MRKKYTNILGKRSSREILPLYSIRTPADRIAIYAEAKLEPIIASYLNAVSTLLNQVRLAVVGEDGKVWGGLLPKDFQREFIKAVVDRVVFGSGVLEVTYTPELDVAHVGHRPINTFLQNETALDEHNNIISLTQQALHGNYNRSRVVLPREKLVILNENPDLCTGSKLEGCISTYVSLKNLREILLVGADRALVGVPHFELPDEPTAEEMDRLEAIAENLHSSDDLLIITRAAEVGDPSTGTTFKTGYGFDLKTTDTSPIGAINNTIAAMEKTLATVLLSQFLLLSSGSYALSKDHSDLFLMSLKGILEEAIDDVERDLLSPLAEERGLGNLYLVASDFVTTGTGDLVAMLPLVNAGILTAEQLQPAASELIERKFGGM